MALARAFMNGLSRMLLFLLVSLLTSLIVLSVGSLMTGAGSVSLIVLQPAVLLGHGTSGHVSVDISVLLGVCMHKC